MWRVSSLLWGIGTPLDAALRVVMAYTLPPDLVPALGTALAVATSVVLVVVSTIFYEVSGDYRRDSALCRPLELPKLPTRSEHNRSARSAHSPPPGSGCRTRRVGGCRGPATTAKGNTTLSARQSREPWRRRGEWNMSSAPAAVRLGRS